MFDPTEWKDLARACRAMAVRLEKDAKAQEGTTIHRQALKEVQRFREYAERCELASQHFSGVERLR